MISDCVYWLRFLGDGRQKLSMKLNSCAELMNTSTVQKMAETMHGFSTGRNNSKIYSRRHIRATNCQLADTTNLLKNQHRNCIFCLATNVHCVYQKLIATYVLQSYRERNKKTECNSVLKNQCRSDIF